MEQGKKHRKMKDIINSQKQTQPAMLGQTIFKQKNLCSIICVSLYVQFSKKMILNVLYLLFTHFKTYLKHQLDILLTAMFRHLSKMMVKLAVDNVFIFHLKRALHMSWLCVSLIEWRARPWR